MMEKIAIFLNLENVAKLIECFLKNAPWFDRSLNYSARFAACGLLEYLVVCYMVRDDDHRILVLEDKLGGDLVRAFEADDIATQSYNLLQMELQTIFPNLRAYSDSEKFLQSEITYRFTDEYAQVSIVTSAHKLQSLGMRG